MFSDFKVGLESIYCNPSHTIVFKLFNKCIMVTKTPATNFPYTLSKCPGGYPILHRGLKLNSKNSAVNIKKKNSPGTVDFPPRSYVKIFRYLPRSFSLSVMLKKYKYFTKRVITMTKIQSARASHITI